MDIQEFRTEFESLCEFLTKIDHHFEQRYSPYCNSPASISMFIQKAYRPLAIIKSKKIVFLQPDLCEIEKKLFLLNKEIKIEMEKVKDSNNADIENAYKVYSNEIKSLIENLNHNAHLIIIGKVNPRQPRLIEKASEPDPGTDKKAEASTSSNCDHGEAVRVRPAHTLTDYIKKFVDCDYIEVVAIKKTLNEANRTKKISLPNPTNLQPGEKKLVKGQGGKYYKDELDKNWPIYVDAVQDLPNLK